MRRTGTCVRRRERKAAAYLRPNASTPRQATRSHACRLQSSYKGRCRARCRVANAGPAIPSGALLARSRLKQSDRQAMTAVPQRAALRSLTAPSAVGDADAPNVTLAVVTRPSGDARGYGATTRDNQGFRAGSPWPIRTDPAMVGRRAPDRARAGTGPTTCGSGRPAALPRGKPHSHRMTRA